MRTHERDEPATVNVHMRARALGFVPVTNPPRLPGPLDRLKFDDDGSPVPYRGEDWRIDALAKADPQLAAYGADVLAPLEAAADLNNRACALLLGPSTDLEEVRSLLRRAAVGSKAAARNQVLLPKITAWLGVR